jgi:glycogen debranching enzyme
MLGCNKNYARGKCKLFLFNNIFDGDEPHISRGCISQAWSVAEPLRAYIEDVAFVRPRHEKEVLENLAY